MNGKGDTYRPVNQKKYEANYDKAFRGASDIRTADLTTEQIERLVQSGDPNFYATTRIEDWGPRKRGQGKRSGGMVVGAMSAAPTGKVEYTNILGKLPESEAKDIQPFEPDEYKRRYAQARSVGFSHHDALRVAYYPEIVTSDA